MRDFLPAIHPNKIRCRYKKKALTLVNFVRSSEGKKIINNKTS